MSTLVENNHFRKSVNPFSGSRDKIVTMNDDDRLNLAQRLALAVERAGGRASAIARMGIPGSTLDRYLRGENEPQASKLAKIAEVSGLSVDWLVNGGPISSISEASGPVVAENGDADDPDLVMIPRMSAVAMAGNGWHNHEVEVIERLPFSRELLRRLGVRREFAHFIQHTGDSMYPTLQDGGVSLVDTSRQRARDGKIFALMIGDDLVIKRLQVTPRGLTLISDNGDRYPPVELSGDELERVRIMGQVFWSGGVV
jgi:phage repressor protein C with HTH and peptisase S24 domain